jgi:hypothetical protein
VIKQKKETRGCVRNDVMQEAVLKDGKALQLASIMMLLLSEQNLDARSDVG